MSDSIPNSQNTQVNVIQVLGDNNLVYKTDGALNYMANVQSVDSTVRIATSDVAGFPPNGGGMSIDPALLFKGFLALLAFIAVMEAMRRGKKVKIWWKEWGKNGGINIGRLADAWRRASGFSLGKIGK